MNRALGLSAAVVASVAVLGALEAAQTNATLRAEAANVLGLGFVNDDAAASWASVWAVPSPSPDATSKRYQLSTKYDYLSAQAHQAHTRRSTWRFPNSSNREADETRALTQLAGVLQ